MQRSRSIRRSGARTALALVLAATLAVGLLVAIKPAWAATLQVDTTLDDPAATACTAAPDDCSLRGAIINANGAAGADTINVPAGTYELTIPGPPENLALTGDLDITGDLTINGEAASSTIVKGGLGFIDRIFENHALTTTISGLTITRLVNVGPDTGGGILNHSATLEVTNSTFSGNSAGVLLGGGISHNNLGSARLRNTIVAGSTSGFNCSGAITDGGYNISDDVNCVRETEPTSRRNTDPLLDPDGLKDNGGPTQTIALQQGSPAIDQILQGTNECGTTITTDQRGVKRPQDGDDNGTELCDIGAFEVAKVSPPTPPGGGGGGEAGGGGGKHHHKKHHHGGHHHKNHKPKHKGGGGGISQGGSVQIG